ncbi:Thermophilic serine proteinase [Paramyrothecium foliicola]|nr:Thermophilic serine proteinase [Paramyrothecium foliicola]
MHSHITLSVLAAAGLAFGAEHAFINRSSHIVEYKDGITKRENIFSRNTGIKVLRALPEVANVWPNRYYEPMMAMVRPTSDKSTRLPPETDLDPSDYDTHNETGVRDLHKRGIKGKGVKVAIVDTGVDYSHPDLDGCFGPGCKVAGGYDFAGDGDWPVKGLKQPHNDPKDLLGHGSHVAGILAGEGKGWSGVAPEATIYAYKTFANAGTDEFTNIDALLRAYEDGVDIITASIGLNAGWANGAFEEVVIRIADKGVVITVSVGNGGESGPCDILSPSAAKGVIGVSNIDTLSSRDANIAVPSPETSWALLYDLDLKPDVGAPGTQIYSTVLNHGWSVHNGTSMATPYLTGHGADFAKLMRNRLVSNVRKVSEESMNGSIAPVTQIGSGLINATSLFATTTDLLCDRMALNDTRYFNRYHKVTVINKDDKPVEYTFAKEDSIGLNTLNDTQYGNIVALAANLQYFQYNINATLPGEFTLQPGKSKEVTVASRTLTNPIGPNPSCPSTAATSLQSLDPPVRQGLNGSVPTFSFNLTARDFPIIWAGIRWGTRQLHYDIFQKGFNERSWTWLLVLGQNGSVISATSWVGMGGVPIKSGAAFGD